MTEIVDCELIGTRLIVWNPTKSVQLYRSGFFGKPVGMAKPKPEQEFDAPLMLDLMEGIFLLEKRKIRVFDAKTKRRITGADLRNLAEATYDDFNSAYSVYRDLREKGYVVTPGIKFGADFAVYERGPGIDHAPFLVSVKSKNDSMGSFEIVRAGRLATTVRKRFTIGIPTNRRPGVEYLAFSWFKA